MQAQRPPHHGLPSGACPGPVSNWQPARSGRRAEPLRTVPTMRAKSGSIDTLGSPRVWLWPLPAESLHSELISDTDLAGGKETKRGRLFALGKSFWLCEKTLLPPCEGPQTGNWVT